MIADYLRAVSQSFFFSNAYFGAGVLLFLLVFDPNAFICATAASLVSYFHSRIYSTPKLLRDWGLITVNGFFFGLAMASLFRVSPAMILCLMIGSLSIPLLTKASFEVLQHWKLSPFILPYIATAWVIWLCAKGFSLDLQTASWPDLIATLPSQHPGWSLGAKLLDSGLESVGRLLFVPNAGFGLAILLWVATFSPRRGFFFAAGTAAATLISFLMAGGSAAWEYGYFNYSAGLVGLGLASFPEMFSARTILLFAVLSSFFTMASEQLLGAAHLPALSIPYVVTMWLAMLSRSPRINLSWNASSLRYRAPPRARPARAGPKPELAEAGEKAS